MTQTMYFDDCTPTKVVYFTIEYNMAEGWCHLLKDPLMVARVIQGQKLSHVYIYEYVPLVKKYLFMS